jgi:hypothetical protein
MFVRVHDDALLDADRVGLADLLAREGLTLPNESRELSRRPDGGALAFDGRWTDLQLDGLSQAEPVTGRIDHAALGPEEVESSSVCAWPGKMMVTSPQGSPMYIVPAETHAPEEVPDPVGTVWVGTPAEPAEAPGVSFGDFSRFRDRVVGQPGPDAGGESAR